MARIQRVCLILATMAIAVRWPWMAPSVTEATLLQTILSWIDPGQRMWDDLLSRIIHFQRLGRKSICYESVGCFHVRGPLSHLRQLPDHPRTLQTGVWICTRRFPDPVDPELQLITYDNNSVEDTIFDPGLPIKVLVHGYGGQSKNPNIIAAKNSLLQTADVNVLLVNWQRAARGQYHRAVSNAELVGRLVGKTLISMVALGTHPSDVHVIGFSLGAQVAGFVGETLKRHGMKLGRITGLDPASFLFESGRLPSSRRLDHTDAGYVEVIHTDGSRIWSDGFGLLAPVGHVDYFPNGGVDQPGCEDSYVDALAFGLSNNANSTGVCSHGRAWEIFLEILTSSHCHFIGFPCPGVRDFRRDFQHGNCFGPCGDSSSTCAVMGLASPARGPRYLVTRATSPYCGQQLRATVWVSPTTLTTRGFLQMKLHHGSSTTDFTLNLQSPDVIEGGREMSVIAAAKPGSVSVEHNPNLTATLTFTPSQGMRRIGGQHHLFLDRISLVDHNGNSWQYCEENLFLEDKIDTASDSVTVELTQHPCL
ncbi:pancreatic triacylglycerol lipase-like [Periplaneta americana]|uniref:pancreatic triacylglycerol lipase-like n=1 Tax=Periplaneta americana TaxID=6978 RepID=UPI0037E86451